MKFLDFRIPSKHETWRSHMASVYSDNEHLASKAGLTGVDGLKGLREM